MYSEGFLALNPATKSVDYISVDRQISQPPTDPDYISVKEYIQAISAGRSFGKDKITPPVLADMLEQDCNKALALVKNINVPGNHSLMYEVDDIKVWANLGLYFAQKLRGAVALQQYRVLGNEAQKKQAVDFLGKALHYWDVVIAITTPIYKEMPLVHFSEQHGVRSKENDRLRFHWKLLRPDVANDIEIAKSARADTGKDP